MKKEPGEPKTLAEAVENFPQIKDKAVAIGPEGEFILARGEELTAELFKKSHCINCRAETEEEELKRTGQISQVQDVSVADLGGMNSALPTDGFVASLSKPSSNKSGGYDYSFFAKRSGNAFDSSNKA